jgi:hypothetical protein
MEIRNDSIIGNGGVSQQGQIRTFPGRMTEKFPYFAIEKGVGRTLVCKLE